MQSKTFAQAVCLTLLFVPVAAVAQSAGSQLGDPVVIPPPPPIVATPLSQPTPSQNPVPTTPPPGLVRTPMLPANTDTGTAPDQTAPAQTAGMQPPVSVPATPPVPADNWVPGQTAGLGALDKVDGSVANMTIPVGSQSNAGDMKISVLACVARPPDQIPDAAVFVSIQTTGNPTGPPLYRGWMVRSIPGAAVVGDASATLRVVSCS